MEHYEKIIRHHQTFELLIMGSSKIMIERAQNEIQGYWGYWRVTDSDGRIVSNFVTDAAERIRIFETINEAISESKIFMGLSSFSAQPSLAFSISK